MKLRTFRCMFSWRDHPLFRGVLGSAMFMEVVAFMDDRFSATASATLARFHIHSTTLSTVYSAFYITDVQFIINKQLERTEVHIFQRENLEGGLMEIAAPVYRCSPFLGTTSGEYLNTTIGMLRSRDTLLPLGFPDDTIIQ